MTPNVRVARRCDVCGTKFHLPPNVTRDGSILSVRGVLHDGCPACDPLGCQLLVPLERDLARAVDSALEKLRARSEKNLDRGAQNSLEATLRSSIVVSFGSGSASKCASNQADEAPAFVRCVPADELMVGDHEWIVSASVHERVMHFIARVRDSVRIAGALGPSFQADVHRAYLDLHGPPGTGKTTASRIVAKQLGLPLYEVVVAELQSSLVGEIEKNIAALFAWMKERPGVLFFDEADSLLDARIDARSGHEKALNAARNTFINELNRHRGVVCFATNLRVSYDPAISRRLYGVHIPPPDADLRRKIWRAKLQRARLTVPFDPELVVRLEACVEHHYARRDAPARPLTGADIHAIVLDAAVRANHERPSGELTIDEADLAAAIVAHLAQLDAAAPAPIPIVVRGAE